MCTIMTVSKDLWLSNYLDIHTQLELDSRYNNDGYSMLALDSAIPENNTRLQTMSLRVLLYALDDFFVNSSKDARVFLHFRAATTANVGVAYAHAFDDMNGRVFMHNGILHHGRDYTVDSFALVFAADKSAEDMLGHLLDKGETYANIFAIDTETYTYDVVRLQTNTLYTDGHGNYSTNKFGPINQPMTRNSSQTHAMPRFKRTYEYQDLLDYEDSAYLDSWNYTKYR